MATQYNHLSLIHILDPGFVQGYHGEKLAGRAGEAQLFHCLRRAFLQLAFIGQDQVGPIRQQHPVAQGVKSPHLHLGEAALARQLLVDTLAQLLGSFVGEGDCGDLTGFYAPFTQKISKAGHQGLGLSRARTGDDSGYRGDGLDCLALALVESCQGWMVVRGVQDDGGRDVYKRQAQAEPTAM